MHRCWEYSAIPAGCNKFLSMDGMGIFDSRPRARRRAGSSSGPASGLVSFSVGAIGAGNTCLW